MARHALVPPDVAELADLLRPTWPALHAELITSGLPLCEGDADADADKGDDKDDADKDKDDGVDKDDADRVDKDDDWRTKSRKNEAAAKRERKKREEAEAALKKLQDADKSEQQKAIDEAKEAGRKEALTGAEKERRSDRLEVQVTRLSTRGFKIGEGDDAKTVKFADPDDALVHIERALSKGEVDAEDIFNDEGKVNTDALTTALSELLEQKPHLAAGDEGRKPAGDSDARKGERTSSDLEKVTAEEHAQRKYPGNKK